jgi:hypothetical protein
MAATEGATRQRSGFVAGVLLALGFTGGWVVSDLLGGTRERPVESRPSVTPMAAVAVDTAPRLQPANAAAGAAPAAANPLDCADGGAPLTPTASGTLVARAPAPRAEGSAMARDSTESAAAVHIEAVSSEPAPEDLASRAAEIAPSASPLGEAQTESLELETRLQPQRDAAPGSSGADAGLLGHERLPSAQR